MYFKLAVASLFIMEKFSFWQLQGMRLEKSIYACSQEYLLVIHQFFLVQGGTA